MISVIDIGTNTLRATKLEGFCEIADFSERSTILENTINGCLTEEGIADLTKKLKKLIALLGVLPYAFATSAFRSLENAKEVCEYIKETINLDIDILSGEEEAECDRISMKFKIGEASGVGADFGGGSCQLFAFDSNIKESKSLPIGVKRLQARFVTEDVPNDGERAKISTYLKEEIDFSAKAETLYVMGGTARAVLKLTRMLTGKERSNFTLEELQDLANTVFDKNLLPTVKKILPKRYDSMGIGLDVFSCIAETISASRIEIVDCSVREGYILKKVKKSA